MNDRQGRDIKFATEGMDLLSRATEFALVVIIEDEDGGSSSEVLVTTEWLLPFFRDSLDRMYQSGMDRLDNKGEGG